MSNSPEQTPLFYRANDSKIQSDLAKVSINVNNENNAPVVQNSTFSMQEDGSLQIKLEASDPEGDALNFSIVNGPSNGSLSGNVLIMNTHLMQTLMERISSQ